nr:DUF5711 family protein [Massilistercora timonensis]
MGDKRNRKLHIVREAEEGRQEPEEQGGRKRSYKILMAAGAVLLLAVAIFLVIHLQTYDTVRVEETYKIDGVTDSSYEEFAKGVLKYSRDGVSYLNTQGEERWNQPGQFKNPFVDINGTTAAIADKGGNNIMVVQESGVKGEIETTRPIEKIAVSRQGIVSAILKNEDSPQVICYDTAGNILVEHQTSFAGTGYPVDVALSEDGETMMVVYLSVNGGTYKSSVAYYNFGKSRDTFADHQTAYKEYEKTILASGFYLDGSVSAVVGDNCLTIFKGIEQPEEATTVSLDKEIKSVFHSEKYIGLILKNKGKKGYELCLYNASGKKVMSEDFSGDYGNIKLSGNQVIMYAGRKCSIFLSSGVKKFEGEMDNDILEILPISGVNKYIVMNANGMEDIRLVK